MEKEFIPYTLAVKLKALGFDEPCFGRHYYKESYPMLNPQSEETELVFEFGQYIKQTDVTILAPTFQQAFRWFREKYNLNPSIMYNGIGQWDYDLKGDWSGRVWDSYEDAELDCLDKLIEIVETKSE